jgi:hypothetical protein
MDEFMRLLKYHTFGRENAEKLQNSLFKKIGISTSGEPQ